MRAWRLDPRTPRPGLPEGGMMGGRAALVTACEQRLHWQWDALGGGRPRGCLCVCVRAASMLKSSACRLEWWEARRAVVACAAAGRAAMAG